MILSESVLAVFHCAFDFFKYFPQDLKEHWSQNDFKMCKLISSGGQQRTFVEFKIPRDHVGLKAGGTCLHSTMEALCSHHASH